jgi:hypothetical protein
MTMKYLNVDAMHAIDIKAFRTQEPYPWINPQCFLTDMGFAELQANMPTLEMFEASFGKERKYGQQQHNRYVLEYVDGLDLPPAWQAFVEELKSKEYHDFIRLILARGHFKLRFHWHYTPNGCVVSPHCDARGKLGTQIFYMNSHDDWNTEWGGQTVVLDDNGRFDLESNPAFEDFDREFVAETMDNRSFIFARKLNSWHGVREIQCPEGAFRKVFIVVFEDVSPRKILYKRITRLLKGKPMITEKERAMY